MQNWYQQTQGVEPRQAEALDRMAERHGFADGLDLLAHVANVSRSDIESWTFAFISHMFNRALSVYGQEEFGRPIIPERRHTVAEALDRFSVCPSITLTGTKQSVIQVLGWMDEYEYSTDLPPSSHIWIATYIIRMCRGEEFTETMLQDILKIGEHHVLDTWWIPDEAVLWALSHTHKADPPTRFNRIKSVLGAVERWKQTRERPNLTGADISGHYLEGSSTLSGVNLTCANLSETAMYGVSFHSASLVRANLEGLRLYWADLQHADLSFANLRNAELRSVDLRDADLTSARVDGASIEKVRANKNTILPSGWELTESGLVITGGETDEAFRGPRGRGHGRPGSPGTGGA